jgi:hypothetical protein
MLHMPPVLVNDEIFLEALHRTVHLEFLSAIVSFGGRGKNLDDEKRVDNDILSIARVLEIAANDAAAGISVQSSRGSLDA